MTTGVEDKLLLMRDSLTKQAVNHGANAAASASASASASTSAASLLNSQRNGGGGDGENAGVVDLGGGLAGIVQIENLVECK